MGVALHELDAMTIDPLVEADLKDKEILLGDRQVLLDHHSDASVETGGYADWLSSRDEEAPAYLGAAEICRRRV